MAKRELSSFAELREALSGRSLDNGTKETPQKNHERPQTNERILKSIEQYLCSPQFYEEDIERIAASIYGTNYEEGIKRYLERVRQPDGSIATVIADAGLVGLPRLSARKIENALDVLFQQNPQLKSQLENRICQLVQLHGKRGNEYYTAYDKRKKRVESWAAAPQAQDADTPPALQNERHQTSTSNETNTLTSVKTQKGIDAEAETVHEIISSEDKERILASVKYEVEELVRRAQYNIEKAVDTLMGRARNDELRNMVRSFLNDIVDGRLVNPEEIAKRAGEIRNKRREITKGMEGDIELRHPNVEYFFAPFDGLVFLKHNAYLPKSSARYDKEKKAYVRV